MRKSRIIDALFPRIRHQVLSTLVLAPERSWYMSDLAVHLGTVPSSLQRELDSLVRAGILNKTRDGNRTYFKANTECPVLQELQGLFTKTAGLVDKLRDALQPFAESLQVAFVYGSFASNSERMTSDVDLMLIGSLNLAELAPSLRSVEDALSRPVNPTLYSAQEFRNKVQQGHHFLTTVMSEPKLFIIGHERELAAITDGR